MASKWLDLGIDWLNPVSDNRIIISAGMIALIDASEDRKLGFGVNAYDKARCNDIRYALSVFRDSVEDCMSLYRDLDFNENGVVKIGASANDTVRTWSSDGIVTAWYRVEAHTGENFSVFYEPALINSNTIIFSDILRLGYILIGCFVDYKHNTNRNVMQIDSNDIKYCNGLGLDPNALTAYNEMLSSQACYETDGNLMRLSDRMEVRKFSTNYRYDSDIDYELSVKFSLLPDWIAKGASLSEVIYYRYTEPFGVFDDYGTGVTNGLIEKVPLVDSGGGVFTYQVETINNAFTFRSNVGKSGYVYGVYGANGTVYFPVDAAGFLEYYTP